jgi:protein tyrosine/serine phosphatase
MRKALFGLIPLAAVVLASYLVILDRQGRLVWDHWDEVKKDVLYRSGQLSRSQLSEAIRRYRLKTVINLQLPGPELFEERAVSREMGVDFVNLPMPGDGLGEESQFRKILSILDDPARRPALVHCARGTCRTGAAVAFYRFERDGWTLEDVAAELKRQSYKYGWLPGYIYAMIKTKPAVSFERAGTIEDRNRPVEVGFREEAIHGR